MNSKALFLAAATIVCTGVAPAQNKLGVFTDETAVGKVIPGGKAEFDPAKGGYSITAAGENVWAKSDAFYFVWKKVAGDVTLTADVQWVGTSTEAHRKAMLMIRQDLDPGSSHADATIHGDGSSGLQFRGGAGEQTYSIVAQKADGPAQLKIVKKGIRVTLFYGKPGEELKEASSIEYLSLRNPVYVGLAVCPHSGTALETAVFSNVKLEEASK